MKNNLIILIFSFIIFSACAEPRNTREEKIPDKSKDYCQKIKEIFLAPLKNTISKAEIRNNFQVARLLKEDSGKGDFLAIIEEKNRSKERFFIKVFPALKASSLRSTNPAYDEIINSCPTVLLEAYFGKDEKEFLLNAQLKKIGFFKAQNPFDDKSIEGDDLFPFIMTSSLVRLNREKEAIPPTKEKEAIPPTKEKEAIPLTKDWDSPYLKAIERLVRNDWEKPSIDTKEFNKNSKEIWLELKKEKINWKKLLDPLASEKELVNARSDFSQKGHKVFNTKAGTLVFQILKKPAVVIKLDNRPAEEFSDGIARSYFTASKNAQAVEKKARKAINHLFIPMESAFKSKSLKVDLVFSERIPLFSEAEIDNRVLLYMLIGRAEKDAKVREALRVLFKQMIKYICLTDFDDVNYRNIVFTADGRLSPFDTDYGYARTGVFSFLNEFFAYKLLSKDEVLAAIQADCSSESYKNNPKNIIDLYKDTSYSDKRFKDVQLTFNSIINFLSLKKKDDHKFSLKELDEEYGIIIESILNDMIKKHSGNKKLLGQRCEDVVELVAQIKKEIVRFSGGKLSENQAQEKAEDILEKARKEGKIYASDSVGSLGKSLIKITDYICF